MKHVQNGKSGAFYCAIAVLLLFGLAALLGCSKEEGNEGVAGSGENKEDNTQQEPEGPLDPFLSSLSFTFGNLSEETRKQIIQDFLAALEIEYFGCYWMVCYIGTYNGWVVIGFGFEYEVMPDPIMIDGTRYNVPSHAMHVWKHDANPENNNFYPLEKACDLGFLTLDDLQGVIRGEYKGGAYEYE